MAADLYARRPIVVNADPQRRVYNGVGRAERRVWSKWELVCSYADEHEAAGAAATFRKINPQREYRIVPRSE